MERALFKELDSWRMSKDRKPLLVKGVRQVGKTYLLKDFGKRSFDSYHYINFEKDSDFAKIFDKNLNPYHIIEELSFYLGRSINIETDFVIFDEIQACPKAITSLKYFCEDMPQLCICGAGSLLGIYLGPVSFPVGKVQILNLYPLTFEEFLLAVDNTLAIKALEELKETKRIAESAHALLWDLLKQYFIVGGLPECVATYCYYKKNAFEAFSQVRKKQEDLVLSYYADMTKHSGKVNAMHIDRIFKSIPMQLESSHDTGSKRFKFKGVIPGISHYQRMSGAIDWLQSAGLIIKVPIAHAANLPLMAYTKENIFKLYVFDVGLLGSICNLSPKSILEYNYGSYKGFFAENFVAQELIASDRTLYCWQEKNAEIEFLQEFSEQVLPIEVKAGKITKSKSLSVFASKYHPKIEVVFSGKEPNFHDAGKQFIPLYAAGLLFHFLEKQ